MSAKKKKTASRKSRELLVSFICFLIMLAISGTALLLDRFGIIDLGIFDEKRPATAVTDGTIELHMIDIGQGDSILIMTPDGNILVDAGENSTESEDKLKSYLDDLGITEFKYVIFTHPDADHIGGGDMIVNTYSIDTVLMEPYSSKYGRETKVYTDLTTAIATKSVTVIDPSPEDDVYTVGDLRLTILSPTKDYGDKNENSIVARIDFGETSVMLTGDAEKKAEKDILATYSTSELDCDVLKVGHHGSSTSSTQEFIDAVTPQYAIISVGEGNNYNHPNEDTLKRLEDAGATILRTDQLGSIVLASDGKNFTKK